MLKNIVNKIIFHFSFLYNIKWVSDDIEKQHTYHCSKYPNNINRVNIEKIVVSNKISYDWKGFKYFIRYADDKNVKQFRILLLKVSRYAKHFDETKCLNFLIQDGELLKSNNMLRKRISNLMEKGFDSELMYGEKHLRTKKKPMMVKYNAKRRYTLCLFVIDISRLCF